MIYLIIFYYCFSHIIYFSYYDFNYYYDKVFNIAMSFNVNINSYYHYDMTPFNN